MVKQLEHVIERIKNDKDTDAKWLTAFNVRTHEIIALNKKTGEVIAVIKRESP